MMYDVSLCSLQLLEYVQPVAAFDSSQMHL